MSRTIRRPPPRRRLRAGYVKRLCWRCRGRVSDCSCPARDLVVLREQPEDDLSEEASLPEWCCECVYHCSCEWCDCMRGDYDNTTSLTQPLAILTQRHYPNAPQP